MKKMFAILPAFAFAFVFSFSSASASLMPRHWFHHDSSDIEVNSSNDAYVLNDVEANSNTGDNEANYNGSGKKHHRSYHQSLWGNGGSNNGLGEIITGNAVSDNLVGTTANENDIEITADCGCKGDIEVNSRNRADVRNYVTADSNTGYNEANHNGGTGAIETGNAQSFNTVSNLLNSNVIKITR